MQQTFIEPRARNTDPATSHIAAERAKRFADSHVRRILAALKYGEMNAQEIGEYTGLTVVQVDRRTIELQRKGLIRVKQKNGHDMVWNGMRVWEAA